MIAGRYSTERQVGRGGTGAVWLGRDEVLHRQVALKRVGLIPGAEDADAARAHREARLAARLQHPNVVAVLDFVDDIERGGMWLVMEYVDGSTVAQIVRDRGTYSPDEAATVLRQVADALTAAHVAGIAHRDVKPSNILIDRNGTAKLSDFGVAHAVADPGLTRTGLLIGSPAYLAPEVANGGRGDAAADVWSLGATAYFMLSGKPLYDGGDNVLSILYRIVNDDVPTLPDAGWLAPLLAGTLTKDPARRWTLQQVRDHLDGRHVPPAPPVGETTAVLRPAAAQPGRSRRGLALAALVLALLLGGGVYALTRGGGHQPQRASAPSTHASQPTPKATPAAHQHPRHTGHHRRHRRVVTPPVTAGGMEAFIRRYVSTVAADPAAGWTMLTPKFQRESGGFARYNRFWSPATHGRVLDISADPGALTVSYHVVFDNFHNGPGPTVLKLVHRHGRYLIDGEMTKGFHPAA